jgi:hypothetical protein
MPTPWTTRIWQEYRAGTLTRAARDVLLTLHTYRGRGGAAWPSHQTLADRALCCTRTVLRALKAGEGLGLITWAERRVRAGWRWLRSSNLYRFMVPEMPAVLREQPSCLLPLPSVAAVSVSGAREALMEMRRVATAVPDLLAARRAAMAGRFAAYRSHPDSRLNTVATRNL